MQDFLKAYCIGDFSKRVESERFRRFSYEAIAQNHFKLDLNWIENDEDKALPPPQEILERLQNNLAEAMRLIKEL